jgi:hypothetical protein
MELAVALNLAFQAVEKVAFKFRDLAAAEAGHMDMIALRTSFVKMLFSLHVHEVEFVDETMSLEQMKRAIYRDAVHFWVDALRTAQNLAGIEMLLGSLNHAEYSAALTGHAQTAGHEFGLEASGSFCLG